MRLARRALIVALAMLVLCATVSAQSLRNETDPRNISPSVGTGGPAGGPTGLFTIYDGQTLRRGEFTFSVAYSNFDRDPGNADFTEIPVSFQVGINDHLELFFNTDAYRGVKVNNPSNLSGFYLPNSQLYFGAGTANLRVPAAIILAPIRTGGTVVTGISGAVFRPVGGQALTGFPFVGAAGPNFGLTASLITGSFTSVLGATATPNSGTFGAADNFPGIGSVFGGILPGVVLATSVLPATGLAQALTVPATFTVAPAYLPEAPFVNRLYGESSFSTFVVGGKIRFTDPDNAFGIGVIPFYRFYGDKADDASGFNQLQRGASPGGDIGDFGAIMFFDGRLSRSVNVSANIGYILNSNPKGSFGAGEFTLLDRPDELHAGVGFDFPVNRFFQPVFELRSTQYVGGRTPNAFENSPIEGLAGVKIYPRRYMGFGFAYRYHFNQQDANAFEGVDASTQVIQLTGIDPIGPPPVVTVPPTSVASTIGSFPRGFTESDDGNGFIAQFWIGRRNERAPEFLPNQPPTVSLSSSSATITLPCAPGLSSSTCTPSANQQVQLTATASDPDGDTLLYTYSTTGGRITGEGPNVTWDLAGVTAGTYNATVEVDDGCGCVAFTSTTVTVAECTNCVPPCPTVNVTCPGDVEAGAPITFTANVSGGDPNATVTYNWTVSAGTISSGQGTPSITVDTTGLSGQSVTATAELGGVAPECPKTASCTTNVLPSPTPAQARKFDEYGNIRFNDEKARLDNYATELQNVPGAQGTIIAYGGRVGRAGEAQARADRAKDYLVNTRGIDAGRITTVDGGLREDLTVELWIVPSGAPAPTATPDPNVTEQQAPRRRAPRRSRRR